MSLRHPLTRCFRREILDLFHVFFEIWYICHIYIKYNSAILKYDRLSGRAALEIFIKK